MDCKDTHFFFTSKFFWTFFNIFLTFFVLIAKIRPISMTSQDFHDKFRQHNNHSPAVHFPQTISIHAKYFVSMKK